MAKETSKPGGKCNDGAVTTHPRSYLDEEADKMQRLGRRELERMKQQGK